MDLTLNRLRLWEDVELKVITLNVVRVAQIYVLNRDRIDKESSEQE